MKKMSNNLKYQISIMFEQLYIAIMFVCIGMFICTHDSINLIGWAIWYTVYLCHHSLFVDKYFKLVYKKIEEEKE